MPSARPRTPQAIQAFVPHRVVPPAVRGSDTRRRMNRCMFLEYDARDQRWRDLLARPHRPAVAVPRVAAALPSPRATTPRRGMNAVAFRTDGVKAEPTWQNPVVVGLLLALCPPLGVTLAWCSPAIPHAGRVALTVFGALLLLSFSLLAGVVLR